MDESRPGKILCLLFSVSREHSFGDDYTHLLSPLHYHNENMAEYADSGSLSLNFTL